MDLLSEAIPAVRKLPIPLSRDQAVLLMAAVNEIMLGVDTYLAHSISSPIRVGEWIPILFGPSAGLLLLVAGIIAYRRRSLANLIASLVFLASMAVGLLGSYYHLQRTLLSDAFAGQPITALVLVYAPPLLGPLTFALVALLGLSAAWEEDPLDSGLLRLIGKIRLRMPLSKTRAYFLMTALFILVTVVSSVLDHARTNFVNPWLWLPTIVGVFATIVSFCMGAFERLDRADLRTFVVAMVLMILVGTLGAVLHVLRDLPGQGVALAERFLYGAPLLAPLLFANMGLLGLLVLLDPQVRSKPVPAKKEF